jgi:hypothetical protein
MTVKKSGADFPFNGLSRKTASTQGRREISLTHGEVVLIDGVPHDVFGFEDGEFRVRPFRSKDEEILDLLGTMDEFGRKIPDGEGR